MINSKQLISWQTESPTRSLAGGKTHCRRLQTATWTIDFLQYALVSSRAKQVAWKTSCRCICKQPLGASLLSYTTIPVPTLR